LEFGATSQPLILKGSALSVHSAILFPVHYQTLGIAIVFSIAAVVFIVVTKGDLSYHCE